MRTIGRKYKNKVVSLVAKARKRGLQGAFEITEYVTANIPQAAFDTWESAHQEIERVAYDEVMREEVRP